MRPTGLLHEQVSAQNGYSPPFGGEYPFCALCRAAKQRGNYCLGGIMLFKTGSCLPVVGSLLGGGISPGVGLRGGAVGSIGLAV